MSYAADFSTKVLMPSEGSGLGYSDSACIHDLFEAQALTRPEAVAIESPGEAMTYGELNGRAEALAAILRQAGVRPEVRVAIFADRTPSLFVAILAILKAGGAYFCFDPAYPQERIEQIWADLKAPILLVHRRYAGRLPQSGAGIIILEDVPPATIPAGNGQPLTGERATPTNLAYVIFTSGSTGRPKGILLHHRGLCNLIHASNRLLGLGPGSRLLQFAALSFDVSVWETFMALTSGATLVLPGPSDPLLLAVSLQHILQERRITTALITPCLMALMSPEDLPALQTVVSVGDRLPSEVARRWARGRTLINGYGPAEATITVSAFTVGAEDEYPLLGPPIGRPIPNIRLYVLDEKGQPLPPGVSGELFIGGVGVARGYLDRPELDRERFLPDPFVDDKNSRMYRTGDFARWLPDGNLEFIGRQDNQVKVRGSRVELGEVEAVLRQHPQVREVVVLVREDPPGRAYLAAFYSPAEGGAPDARDLRRHMKERLPLHMVPEEYTILTELPRTPNGKLDRKSSIFTKTCITVSAFDKAPSS